MFPGLLGIGIIKGEEINIKRETGVLETSAGAFEYIEQRADGTTVLRRRTDGTHFEFHVNKDATIRALKLINGELDIIQGDIPPQMFQWLSSQPGVHAHSSKGTTFSYLGFNMQIGETSRREVRLAIHHAIDRECIIKHIFRGHARRAQSLFPPEHWAGEIQLSKLDFDPERARAILGDLDLGDARLQLEYKTSSDPFRLRIATIIKSQLAEGGIDLEVQSLDWGTFYGDVKTGHFQVYSLSWVGLKLPDIFHHAFHSESVPPNGVNRGRYRESAADALIEAAERSDDRRSRLELYHALHERLMYDLPYVPLWYEDQLMVMRDSIVGYSTGVDGNFDALEITAKVDSFGAH